MEIDLVKLKAEIKAEVIKELTERDFHTQNTPKNDPFNAVRMKFAKCKGPLNETFGNYTYARVWESIRAISAACTGTKYIRDLSPIKSEKAAEIANYLCEYVIEQRKNLEVT
jgi:hypothetical protein